MEIHCAMFEGVHVAFYVHIHFLNYRLPNVHCKQHHCLVWKSALPRHE